MSVPVNIPQITAQDMQSVTQCLSDGWVSGEAPVVAEFESEFSRYLGVTECVAVSSGTAACDLAVKLLDLQCDDEVIVPSFSIFSTIRELLASPATLVFADPDPLTFNVTPEIIFELITPKTRAIVLAHIYGLPVDLDPIMEVAKQRGIFIIEDAAELLGANYKSSKVGSLGDVNVFSFYANKHVTTGEGGMLAFQQSELADLARRIRNLGFDRDPAKRFIHDIDGMNLRMNAMSAALGLSQLSRLDESIARKIEIGDRYNQRFKNLAKVQLPVRSTNFAKNYYWVYPLVFESRRVCEHVRAFLEKRKIGTRPFFYPLDCQPIVKGRRGFRSSKKGVANLLYESGLYLPSGLGTSNQQIDYVAETVLEALSNV